MPLTCKDCVIVRVENELNQGLYEPLFCYYIIPIYSPNTLGAEPIFHYWLGIEAGADVSLYSLGPDEIC